MLSNLNVLYREIVNGAQLLTSLTLGSGLLNQRSHFLERASHLSDFIVQRGDDLKTFVISEC